MSQLLKKLGGAKSLADVPREAPQQTSRETPQGEAQELPRDPSGESSGDRPGDHATEGPPDAATTGATGRPHKRRPARPWDPPTEEPTGRLHLDIAVSVRDRLDRFIAGKKRGAQRRFIEYALDRALREEGF